MEEESTALAALRAQFRDLALLSRVAVAANEATDLADATEEIVAMLARHVEWPAATAWILDGAGHLRCSGSWYLERDPRLVALRDAVDARLVVDAGSLAGRVALTGAPTWIANVAGPSPEDPAGAPHDGARDTRWLTGSAGVGTDLGVTSAFAVPVWFGHTVVGVVGMFSADPRAKDDSVLELVEQVATQLGCVVERLPIGGDRFAPGPAAAPAPGPGAGVDRRMMVAAAGQMWQSLSGLAHDVRTPLNGILGALELLAETDLEMGERALLHGALAAASHLHEMVEARLDAVETEVAAALWSAAGAPVVVPTDDQPAGASSIR